MFEQIGGNFSIILGICCFALAAFWVLHAVGSGKNYTKFAAPAPASYMGPEFDGRLIVTHDFVEFSASAAGASWYVGVLKPGEIFLFGLISCSALLGVGGGSTLALGDDLDTDRYMTATSAGASVQSNFFIAGASAGHGYYNGGSLNIPILLAVGTTTITSGTAKVTIIKGRM